MRWERAPDLGARLKDLRIALGLLQEEFAELVGVTDQSISDYETGRSQPSKSRLVRLAAKVGISVSAFQEGGEMPSTLLKRPLEPSNGGGAPSIGTRRLTGSEALKTLAGRMELALEGRPVPLVELAYWLKLVRLAITAGVAADAIAVEDVIDRLEARIPQPGTPPAPQRDNAG